MSHPGDHIATAGLTLASIAGAVGSWVGVFPVIAAVLASMAAVAAIVNYSFQTMDSPSFQRFMSRLRGKS